MSQSIGSIRVKTSSFPIANVATGAVRISVNAGNATRVQSIQYLPTAAAYSIAGASDIEILNTANNESVLTYDSNTNKFVVQNVPRLNGGTF